MAYRAPVAHTQTAVVNHQIVLGVGNLIRHDTGFRHERVQGVFRQTKSTLGDGLRRELEIKSCRLAVGAQRCGQLVQGHGAVEIVPGVVLTAPQQLDGFANRLGDLGRLHNKVDFKTATKTAAQESRLQCDVFRLDTERRRHTAFSTLLKLGGADQQALAVFVICREVLRLQRGVCQQWGDVFGFKGFGCAFHGGCRITLDRNDGNHLTGIGRLANTLKHATAAYCRHWALIPLHRQCLARLVGVPIGVGHHGHAIRNLHHVDHARHGPGLAGVKAFYLAANHRALLQAGVDHAGQLDVNTKLGRTINLGRGVQPPGCLANDGEVFWVFQHYFFRHRQL